MKADSRLERVLRSGRFAVTAELNPPDSADPQAVYDRALVLASVCDAINATDASGANVHMSSVGVCALLTRAGYEPVLQMSCRDRNRIAIQGDLLGAAAMGVRNVLCLTGDGVQAGDQPEASPVFDLDSITLLRTARILRDEGRFSSGRRLETAPRFFLGAAENPFAPPVDFRPLRLAKKVEAGADFIQTQFCFDVPRLRLFMRAVVDLGLPERVFILVGVGPLRSARAGEWMRSQVPGVSIPDEVIDRLRRAPAGRQREEGKRLCVEIIQQVREIPGVHGVHVMAYRQEEWVAEIIEEAGLLPRRRATSRRPRERMS
ncbi:MAG: methylenetetrahydrofolate reductase [Anaerolineales bacterium]